MKEDKRLKLREREPRFVERNAIPVAFHGDLHRRLDPYVGVEYPTPKTDGRWQLSPRGWVGYLPLDRDFGIALEPKVPLGNLFQMLEYAYDLKAFDFKSGLVAVGSLQDFFERLATILCRRVLARARRGLYRTYISELESTPFVRGRIQLGSMVRAPWRTELDCDYQVHTADLVENQIIAWTLRCILFGGFCSSSLRPLARRALNSLRGEVQIAAFKPADCVGRLYNRLNGDYHPLHALCRFFLEHSGPTHTEGDRSMLPFMVNMDRLFELFVARWLAQNPPKGMQVYSHEKLQFGATGSITFDMDIVLRDEATNRPMMVLDTKYKDVEGPSAEDFQQIAFYATALDCSQAALVYPTPPSKPFGGLVRGKTHVRTLCFDLGADIEKGGAEFLSSLCFDDQAS